MRRQGRGSAPRASFAAGAGRGAAQRRAGHHPAQPARLRRATCTARPAGTCSCAPTASCRSPTTRASGGCSCHHCGRAYPQPRGLSQVRGGAAHAGRSGHRAARPRAAAPWCRESRCSAWTPTWRAAAPRPRRILEAFGNARPGVLVGTQMVAKGHDFPDVTLVIVADADVGLYVPDFRAAERTFQLLTQVAGPGRARGAARPRAGADLQPRRPLHPHGSGRRRGGLLPGGAGHTGAPGLSAVRRAHPPGHVVARRSQKAQAAGRHLVERLASYFPASELHGPAPLPRLRGRHRWQVMVAARQGERARTIIGQALAQLEEPYRRRGVVLLVDVDPLSFS